MTATTTRTGCGCGDDRGHEHHGHGCSKDCGCGCGCGGSRPGGCGLAAPVRPAFFCGQLLTDADLTALAGWVSAHRRLSRHRTGWGVVCGLSVTADPDDPSGVLVGPGHAVDACGEDVVVAAPARFDVSGECPPPREPWSLPATGRKEERDEAPRTCVVDLGIRYAEAPFDPVLALGGAACCGSGGCEDSRVRESFTLGPPKVVVDDSIPPGPYGDWEAAYLDAVGIVQEATEEGLPGESEPSDLARWLLDRLASRPPQRFPFLRTAIEAFGQGKGELQFAALLFWIAQDRVLGVVTPDCAAGSACRPVPLARVWLREQDKRLVVTAIDQAPPFRRPVSRDEWPAPAGSVNLGRLIWGGVPDARVALADLGLTVTDAKPWAPDSVADVQDLLGTAPVRSWDKRLVLRTMTVPAPGVVGRTRVVGFTAPPSKRNGGGQ